MALARFLAYLLVQSCAASSEHHTAHTSGGSEPPPAAPLARHVESQTVHIRSTGGLESFSEEESVPRERTRTVSAMRHEPSPENGDKPQSVIRKEKQPLASDASTHLADNVEEETALKGVKTQLSRLARAIDSDGDGAISKENDDDTAEKVNESHTIKEHDDDTAEKVDESHTIKKISHTLYATNKGEEANKDKTSRDKMVEAFLSDEDTLHPEDQELLESLIQGATAKKGPARRRRAIRCMWHNWGGWGACSTSCGWGSWTRYRGQTLARYGGSACYGSTSHSSGCHPKSCPIHCKWGEWTGLTPSACAVTCGGGMMVTSRSKITGPKHGGTNCDDPSLYSLHITCNTQPCGIDCQYGKWSDYSACSLSCGVGMQQRSRDKLHSDSHGGKKCPGEHVETRQCNEHPCPIDCAVGEWVEWEACTEDCGGGKTNRYRPKLVPDQHGGEPCPHINEDTECNGSPCEPAIENGAKPIAKVSIAIHLLLTTAAIFYTERN